jgi:hypothetical protein
MRIPQKILEHEVRHGVPKADDIHLRVQEVVIDTTARKPTAEQLLLIRLLSLLTGELTEREIAVHPVHGSQNRCEPE